MTARVRALRELTEAERPDLFFSVCLAADTTLRAYCQDGRRVDRGGAGGRRVPDGVRRGRRGVRVGNIFVL